MKCWDWANTIDFSVSVGPDQGPWEALSRGTLPFQSLHTPSDNLFLTLPKVLCPLLEQFMAFLYSDF